MFYSDLFYPIFKFIGLGKLWKISESFCKAVDNSFESTHAYKWLSENAYKYGFILRYPADKTDVTGYDYESWHYRFVGRYHATAIAESGLCFEEYLELIRDHSHDNPLTFTADNGNTYQVYYVAYSGNPTSVPVPKNNPYTISGDNMNGFIVTVENIIE